MGSLPRRVFRHRIAIEPYLGDGGTGPLYGPPVSARCFLDAKVRMVRSMAGREVTSTSTAYCPLATVCPAESRVTLPDGRTALVIAALRRDGGGLPTPDHLEVQME